VWLALAKRYMAIQSRPLWPEKPLNRHIGRDLEHLVIQWKSVKVGWATKRSKAPVNRQRHFRISEQSAPYISPCLYLIQGSRWLLVGTRFGGVRYYDLNAVTISATTLIPPLFDCRAKISISVDMDSAVESLTFYLSILTRRSPDENDPDYSPRYAWWIQVWRVRTEVDSHGIVKGLYRKQCHREEYELTYVSFRLQGENVVYSLFYSPLQSEPLNNGHKAIVVNWTIMQFDLHEFRQKDYSYKRKCEWPSSIV
jgi:hypothetical protein